MTKPSGKAKQYICYCALGPLSRSHTHTRMHTLDSLSLSVLLPPWHHKRDIYHHGDKQREQCSLLGSGRSSVADIMLRICWISSQRVKWLLDERWVGSMKSNVLISDPINYTNAKLALHQLFYSASLKIFHISHYQSCQQVQTCHTGLGKEHFE